VSPYQPIVKGGDEVVERNVRFIQSRFDLRNGEQIPAGARCRSSPCHWAGFDRQPEFLLDNVFR
jgi:hypothetical protein